MSYVLELDEVLTPQVRRNGNEQVREAAMVAARREVRVLAEQGLSVAQIEDRVAGRFNGTEQDILWLLASHEVDRARRELA